MWRRNSLGLALASLFLVGCAARRSAANEYDRIIWTADWSADGRIAIGGNQGTLRIYPASLSGRPRVVPVAGTVTNVAWHPTRDLLAVAVQGGAEPGFLVRGSGEALTSLDSVSPDGARGIAWSASGDRLAVADNDGYLTLYDAGGSMLRRRRVDPKGATALGWHPSGDRIDIVGSAWHSYYPGPDSLVSRNFRTEPTLLLTADWNPKGDILALGDYGEPDNGVPTQLQFRDAADSLVLLDAGSRAEYRNVRWDPEGKVLAAAAGGVSLWDADGLLLAHVLRDRYVWGLGWNADGSRLVVTTGDGEAFLLDRYLEILRRIRKP